MKIKTTKNDIIILILDFKKFKEIKEKNEIVKFHKEKKEKSFMK